MQENCDYWVRPTNGSLAGSKTGRAVKGAGSEEALGHIQQRYSGCFVVFRYTVERTTARRSDDSYSSTHAKGLPRRPVRPPGRPL